MTIILAFVMLNDQNIDHDHIKIAR